jgi:ATP-dependent DNA helicase DinG
MRLIVANHALYFTDLITGAGVLPRHDIVVFDEAHHLEQAASNALSVTIGRWSDTKLLQRVRRRFRDFPLDVVEDVHGAESKLIDHLYQRGRGQFPLGYDEVLAELAALVAHEVRQVSKWIGRTDLRQMTLLDDAEDEQTAKQRAEIQKEQLMATADGLAARWEHFSEIDARGDRANWMEVDPSRDYFELRSAPLDVGESLHRLLWTKRTCILTSATLAVDGQFDFIKRELGITHAHELALGSPFDFREQATLFLPRNLPLPNHPTFLEAATATIERILHVSRGRAFVLFTSYRALREVSAALMHRLPFPCKTQEELPRARLIEWFTSTPNSVLFATATFWEGVDVPGDALSCVIIDKLPFASPSDPVVQARTDRMKANGEDWFNDFMLPKAVIALKQGFGRLIRTRTDTGIVAILDRRLTTMRYGQVILRSLPPARRVETLPINALR